jgi:methanogenic corrinoid protein MtbC1
MNEQGNFVASLLDASGKAYAAGAVLRMQEAGPEAAGFVASLGFNALVDDLEIRLQHLAAALAAGRPELFVLDVEWLASTHAARELPPGLLETTLDCLLAELDENLPPDAAAAATAVARAGRDQLGAALQPPDSLLVADEPYVEPARRFLLAVLEGNRDQAEDVIFAALDGGASVADLHVHVIAKAQAEMGRMWQAGEAQVAEEHFGSRIVEDVLAQLRRRVVKQQSTGRTVLTASVAGNLHDIGARIVADHFEMSGWRSIFLGANMPLSELAQAARDFAPDLVALSVGLATNVRSAADTVEALRAAVPGTPILIGGRPFALVADLWKDVGADGCAPTASDAVAIGERLVSG